MRFYGAQLSRDVRDADFHASEVYAGAVPTAVKDYDFRGIHTWRVQRAPSCVAVSMNSKAQILARAQGVTLPPLCYNWSWTGARMAVEPPVPGMPLAITGSNGHQNMKHARDRGFRAESAFPDMPENHARVPPSSAWQAAAVAKLGRWSRIKGEGNPALLRDGILNAFRLLDGGGQCSPPGVVLEVGSRFAPIDGSAWDGEVGDNQGYHDQMMIAYRASDDCVGLASSWGGGEVVFWVPVPILAARGSWFSVIESLIYAPSSSESPEAA